MSVFPLRLSFSRVRILVAAIALTGTLFVGGCPVGPIPPLGPLLNPATGLWSVARSAVLPKQFSGVIPGLGSDVDVVYDRRGVPHITAASLEDLTRALGYVVARDRLFQLEVQSRAPEGRLTELLGPAVLELDRQQRAIGLPWGAERDEAALDPRSESSRVVRAYAEGVNAWIDGMGAGDLPFEYHLLGVKPRRWEPIHTALVGKRMGYVLAYDPQELWRGKVEQLVGKAASDWLFPVNSPIEEPIRPNGSNRTRFEFTPPPDPVEPQTPVARGADEGLWYKAAADPSRHDGALGSNNWAVAGTRSATGFPLLSGDPHLDLTLPSIWYEVHLIVPGDIDVYGVTIPGLPAVIIGFNRNVAWSFTNTGADVLDFYRETLDDETAPEHYELDGEWKALEQRIETYYAPDGDAIATDTIHFTHRGPLRATSDGPLSMRWTILEEGFSTGPFIGAARSSTVDEWLEAMASYPGPAQNGIVADRAGNIALRSTGLYPIRPDDGDGMKIRDGSSSTNDWQGYWPLSEYPFARNPRQEFLASANQQPIDPHGAYRYLGAHWENPWRAMRINRLLRGDTLVTADAMRRYQTDPGNEKAELFVPAFVKAARGHDRLTEAAGLLEAWDRRYTKDNDRAVLFEAAFRDLIDRTWDELIGPGTDRRIRTPGEAVLAGLLRYPESVWWDDLRTADVTETRDDILRESLSVAFGRTKRAYGDPDGGGWRWSELRHANVFHLLGLRALSALDLEVQGGPGNLNPSSGSGRHGASWRMVVELGPEVRARTIYPGGQSGNPASKWYVDRIDQWVRGELDAVLFPTVPAQLPETDIAGRLTLRGEHR
ncbi:MAG: penicillin acylase family protein [Gemmatimonadetes bacterium]|nr:penicillin acylase family protein [Gemmatimonadota bacterium]